MRLGKELVSSLCTLGYFGIGTIALAAQQPLQRGAKQQPTQSLAQAQTTATPAVAWQLQAVVPASPTQPQRVIWQGEPLPGAQPDDVVNTTREPPRQRPEVAVATPPLSSKVPSRAVAPLPAQLPTTDSRQQRQPAAPVLITHLAQKSQQWLNQWGEVEIALQSSRSDGLQGSVALLLPLEQSPQQLLFTQGGWHRDQEGTLLSLGVGQRWFYSAHSHWGCNLFVDYRRHDQHQRLGLGAEQRHSSLVWNLNGYLPLSPRRLVANRADWVRPARGFDLRLQYQPPQQPHWRVNLTTEHYWGTIAATRDHGRQHNPTAVTLGVAYTPLPLVTAGYDFKVGTGQQRSHQLQLTLHYHLGVPLAHQLDPQQVAATQSLEGNRLNLVQRSRHLVLQQQPNDEIQLILQPERIVQPVGSRVTIALQLRSSRPLKEWMLEWQGDLLQHTAPPQINAAQDQAGLILPSRPGNYRIQLVARNARGVVAYSNELWVIAEAVEVPANQHAPGPATRPAAPVQPSDMSHLTPTVDSEPVDEADGGGRSGTSVTPPAAHNPDVEAPRDACTGAAPPGSEATAPVVPMGDQAPTTMPTPAVSGPSPPMPEATGGDETPKRSQKAKNASQATPPTQTPGSSSSTPGLDKSKEETESDANLAEASSTPLSDQTPPTNPPQAATEIEHKARGAFSNEGSAVATEEGHPTSVRSSTTLPGHLEQTYRTTVPSPIPLETTAQKNKQADSKKEKIRKMHLQNIQLKDRYFNFAKRRNDNNPNKGMGYDKPEVRAVIALLEKSQILNSKRNPHDVDLREMKETHGNLETSLRELKKTMGIKE